MAQLVAAMTWGVSLLHMLPAVFRPAVAVRLAGLASVGNLVGHRIEGAMPIKNGLFVKKTKAGNACQPYEASAPSLMRGIWAPRAVVMHAHSRHRAPSG